MIYALIENGIVTNVIEAPEGYVAPFGQAIAIQEGASTGTLSENVESKVGIGWQYENGVFTAPEMPDSVPAPLPDLTPRQFWLAALELGITEEGLIASISDPNDALYIEDEAELEAVKIDIRKATSFRRDYPLVGEIAQAHGLPPEQMDALWAWAAQIE